MFCQKFKCETYMFRIHCLITYIILEPNFREFSFTNILNIVDLPKTDLELFRLLKIMRLRYVKFLLGVGIFFL